jgi:hypothetical protein
MFYSLSLELYSVSTVRIKTGELKLACGSNIMVSAPQNHMHERSLVHGLYTQTKSRDSSRNLAESILDDILCKVKLLCNL